MILFISDMDIAFPLLYNIGGYILLFLPPFPVMMIRLREESRYLSGTSLFTSGCFRYSLNDSVGIMKYDILPILFSCYRKKHTQKSIAINIRSFEMGKSSSHIYYFQRRIYYE